MAKVASAKLTKEERRELKGTALVPLFTLDETGNLVINRTYVKGMYPFKDILDADTSTDKKLAYKIFMYIYLMHDINSELDGLTPKQKYPKAIRISGLIPDKFDPEIKEIKDAEVIYGEIFETLNPQIRLVKTLRDGLHITQDIAQRIITKLRLTMEREENNAEIQNNPALALTNLSELLTSLNSFNEIAQSLPKTLLNLGQVYESMKLTSINDEDIVGGGAVGNREEPKQNYATRG